MITAVYVLISSDKDLYYEQALVSLYSLRLYNPHLSVVLMVDDTTENTLYGKRALIRELVSEVKVIETPKQYTAKERSRHIKTTFRKYLKGNLLFIDTDTVVTDRLDDIETVDADIACVLDYHATLDKLVDRDSICMRMMDLFNHDIRYENRYYNSGVMFVKDTQEVHQLFDKWHSYWKHSAFVKNQCYDQPALMMADIECGHLIKDLGGIYNCQILTSVQYLHRAKIIHFFNNQWDGKEEFSPFFQNELYTNIKKTGQLTSDTKALISDCKSSFLSPTYYVCADNVRFNTSLVGRTMYSLYRKNCISYKIIKLLCTIRFNIATFIGRKIKK